MSSEASEWRIGTVRLPLAPYQVRLQYTKNYQEIATYFQMPILMVLGPKVPKLTIKGYITEPGRTAEQLWLDYVRPLRDMVLEGMFTLVNVFDEDTSTWTAASGSIFADSSNVKHGNYSMKVTLSSESLDIYRDYSDAQLFGLHDFFSFHFQGLASGNTIYVEFWNENYASKTNGFYYQFTDSSTNWRWFVIPKAAFNLTGDPSGWDSIKCVRFYSSGTFDGSLYFDYMRMGVGVYLSTPYERFNGIWVPVDFKWEEKGGLTTVYSYEMTLLGQNDLYRGVEP